MSSIHESIEDIKRTPLNKSCLEECLTTCCEFSELELTKNELKLLYAVEINKSLLNREKRFLHKIASLLGYKETFEDLFEKKVAFLLQEWTLWECQDGIYTLRNMRCPRYDVQTKKCEIHDNPKRPIGCKKTPLFLEDSEVNLNAFDCPYVRKNYESIVEILETRHKDEIDKLQIRFMIHTGREFEGCGYGGEVKSGIYDIKKDSDVIKQKIAKMR